MKPALDRIYSEAQNPVEIDHMYNEITINDLEKSLAEFGQVLQP